MGAGSRGGGPNVLVLDVGTSGLKGVLFDGDGRPLASHRVPYAVRAAGERVEQDPAEWVAALAACCRAMAGGGPGVGAIALTCQRSSLVPVDAAGEPVGSAIMWQDTRSAPIVEGLGDRAGRIEALAGARPNTVFLAPKIVWLRSAEPGRYGRTARFCTVASYLLHRLTGRYVTDETYGARSLLMGVRSRRWEPELLELFGVGAGMLCELAAPGSAVGDLTRGFAELTGLAEGIPVVSAGGDQQCGALGQGLVDDEVVTATLGTSACLLRLTEGVPEASGGLVCGVHAMPGRWVLESSMPTCGAFLEWVRRTLLPDGTIGDLEGLARESEPGARGVLALPHLQGRGTPDWQSGVRGAFLGIHLGTSRADLARAGFEAIAFEVRNQLEGLVRLGGPVSALRVGGGVAQSALLRQLLADVTGLTVLSAAGPSEDTAFGAWMGAAVALGLCDGYADAFSRSTTYLERTMPRGSDAGVYGEARARANDALERLYGRRTGERPWR